MMGTYSALGPEIRAAVEKMKGQTMSELQHVVNLLDQANDQLYTERERVEAALQVTRSLQAQLMLARQRSDKYQHKLEAMTQERDELRGKLAVEVSEHSMLVIKLNKTEQQLAASERRFTDAENERIEWVQRGEAAEATIDAQCREAASLNQCITDLEEKVRLLEREVYEKQDVRLLTKLANANQECDQLQATVAALTERNKQFFGTDHDHTTAYWQVKCQELEATVTAQQEEIGRLRDELGYIEKANTKDWDDPTDFKAWAQNRARHALAAKGGA